MVVNTMLSYLSDATMKTSWFTGRYFPLPQPISTPIEPGCQCFKKRSTIGQGCVSSANAHRCAMVGVAADLVPRRGEVRSNLFVNIVNVFVFVSDSRVGRTHASVYPR